MVGIPPGNLPKEMLSVVEQKALAIEEAGSLLRL
jgi:hypothetical protein